MMALGLARIRHLILIVIAIIITNNIRDKQKKVYVIGVCAVLQLAAVTIDNTTVAIVYNVCAFDKESSGPLEQRVRIIKLVAIFN